MKMMNFYVLSNIYLNSYLNQDMKKIIQKTIIQ